MSHRMGLISTSWTFDWWNVQLLTMDVISTSPFATTCKILSNSVHNGVFYVYIYIPCIYIYTIYIYHIYHIYIFWSRLLSVFSNLIPPVGHGFDVHLRPRERTTTRSWWTPSSYQKLGRLNDQLSGGGHRNLSHSPIVFVDRFDSPLICDICDNVEKSLFGKHWLFKGSVLSHT